MNKGVYVHIPFCVSKCPYCDFYSAPAGGEERIAYAERLLFAVKTAPWEFTADTLYLGGGTPTTLPPSMLVAIRDAVETRYGAPLSECTIEANPGTVTADTLKELVDGGFTRVSFGVQSLHPATLSALGRIHTAHDAEEAVLLAHKAGFRHISADLMLAVPQQTLDDIRHDVAALAALPIDHLSAYLLHVEEGTFFAGRVNEPDGDFAADCFETAAASAREAGFFHYEISNFARDPSAQSRHNLHYWRCDEYLGVGAGAHSFVDGRRFFLPRDRKMFLTAADPWALCVPDGDGGDEEERVMLGLRLAEGIGIADFSGEMQTKLTQRAAPLIRAGLCGLGGGRLSLTERGMLVSNAVIASLLG
jgi:oxygen-independent coproporphyrinogen-3 oxidase